MDPADFPYRVLDEVCARSQAIGALSAHCQERLHVLLLGLPLTGKSSLAGHLESGKRKILSLDPQSPRAVPTRRF